MNSKLFFLLKGIQPFCIAAIDNHGVSTAQYCFSIVINATSPSVTTPILVQASASPVGTVMSTQRRFSIQGICKESTIFYLVIDINILRIVYCSQCSSQETDTRLTSNQNLCR